MSHEFGPRRRISRRALTLLISATSVLVLIVIALVLPVPYIKMAPGPTFNTIGEIDGKPVIEISGTQTYPVTGNLDMTTVLESGGPRGGLTFFEAIAGWFTADDAVLPRELLFPDDVNGEQVQREQSAAMSTSQSDAIGAALNYLKRPVTKQVVVTEVVYLSPADGKLEPKDEILTVNGTKITEPKQVGELVRANPIGTTFTFEVKRDTDGTETTQKIDVTSAANPDGKQSDGTEGQPFIGIAIGYYFTPPFTIDFTLEDVGGPSAGLMFSLGIVDKLTEDNLANGKHIAGTGTIDPDGNVGPIGGIRQKLAGARNAGAELFLMPKAHCAEAQGHIPDGLTVVPVTNISDAVTDIQSWQAGKALPTCSNETT